MPVLMDAFPADDGFLAQVSRSLSEMEANLNRLEQEPEDFEALEEAFRRAHAINGSAAKMDFPGLSQMAHAMEDVLGDAYDRVIPLDEAALSLLRRSLFLASLLVELLKTGAGDDGRLVKENEADHAAFRQQLERRFSIRDIEVREAEVAPWLPGKAMKPKPGAGGGNKMAQMTVHVRTVHEAPTAVGWAGNRTLTIDRPEQAGGMGLGYSGGELLFLSIGACYCNDIFREADKRGIVVKSVQVKVSGDWGGEPVRAQNVTFSAKVEAEASEAEIRALMEHTDRVAEIPNSLRMGTPVQLAGVQAISLPRRAQE